MVKIKFGPMFHVFPTLLFILYHVSELHARHDNCQYPDVRHLQKLRDKIQTNIIYPILHDSFHMINERLGDAMQYENVEKKFIKTKSFGFSRVKRSHRRCPTDGYNYNVCPSYFEMEYDVNRIPDIMVQAKCRCSGCLGVVDNNTRKCEPVQYYTRVYRVTNCNSTTGFYGYDEVWEPVSVGCQCAIVPTVVNEQ